MNEDDSKAKKGRKEGTWRRGMIQTTRKGEVRRGEEVESTEEGGRRRERAGGEREGRKNCNAVAIFTFFYTSEQA